MRWTVLVPLKALPEAKSRLIGAVGDPAEHRRLVEAIRADTLAATTAAAGVARVVTVLDAAADPVADGLSFVQSRPGLNAGLAEAAGWAGQRWPEDGIAALLGDLPALRAPELAAALSAAAASVRAFVPDRHDVGTTLLTARPGTALAPGFGGGSAARHAASGAARLDAGPGLRTDVDTAADLAEAAELGFGPATTAAVPVSVRPPCSSGHGMIAG